ncbi:hypothetical protein ALO94_201142 [Pseudomonas syringae pv. spinaceae]|uniref:TonB protein n=1 Tax=Pseudomonas syringae pv. spinaceae TaxID=264459 RepID=A0A0N8TCN2_PSESX|nr:hypothetical protein ALO94_201142 [Pseudomonas syringae pv. spinaceae]
MWVGCRRAVQLTIVPMLRVGTINQMQVVNNPARD